MNANTIPETPVETKAPPKAKKAAKPSANGKKAPAAKKAPKATDGTLRGVAKPKNWKPEVKKMSYAELKETTGSGLRKPQARLLSFLAKARGPLNRAKLAELTKIDRSWVGDWIGYSDSEKRAAQEEKWGHTTLLTLKFVTEKHYEVAGKAETGYLITPAGKKELDAFNEAGKAREAAKKTAEKEKADRAKERAKKAAAAK